MAIFKLFLKALSDKVPNDVLQGTGRQLKSYFDRILSTQATRTLTEVAFKVGANAREIGDKDLLAYISYGDSFILKEMDRLGLSTKHPLPAGSASGGTIGMPDGGVCSEIFWTGRVDSPQPIYHG